MMTGICYSSVLYLRSGTWLFLLNPRFNDSDEEDTASASMLHNQRAQVHPVSSNGSAPSTTLR